LREILWLLDHDRLPAVVRGGDSKARRRDQGGAHAAVAPGTILAIDRGYVGLRVVPELTQEEV